MNNTATKRPIWHSLAFKALLIALTCFGAYFAGKNLGGKPRGDGDRVATADHLENTVGGLYIEASSLAIGEVWESPEHVVPLTLSNRSDRTIHVAKFMTSCECTQVEPSEFAIGPNASKEVRVKLDLTHRQIYQVGNAIRSISLDLTPVFQDSPLPANKWVITGAIKSRVTLSADLLHFEDMCNRQAKPVTRVIRAVAHDGTISLEAIPQSPGVVAKSVARQDKPGQFDIQVTPDPEMPAGPFRSRVDVTAIGVDGKRHLCAWFTVDGDMQPPGRLVPSLVLLGDHAIGSKATATISVVIPSGPGWSVEKAETDSIDTTVRAGETKNGVSNFEITQVINGKKDQTRTIYVVVLGPGGVKSRSTATVSFYGSEAQAKAQP